ncbi:MAG: DUF86 domain-containing protein [Fimbriimonadales bacterium]|nr:DUF86 domain-containing protein [Fimbriimonadales bacterium]
MAIREKYAHLPPLAGDIAQRLERLPELLARMPVRAAYLFGSALECPQPCGDIDIAVVPDENYSFPALYAQLSRLLNTDRIDLVELPSAPFWLQREVLRTGVRLYAREPSQASLYEAGMLALCEELQHRLRRHAPILARRQPMELDKDFLWQVVLNLNRVADELEQYRSVRGDELATNLSLRWTVEHGLQSGLTLILQAANHILTRRFNKLAESYEASLADLRAQRVISASLYRRLRGAGGFRNVLVHEYLQIDLARVARFAKRAPAVFRTFADELMDWLETLEQASDASSLRPKNGE